MTPSGESTSYLRNLIEVFSSEFAWYPGRSTLVARMVLACITVMLLAEVFRIPGAILGASFPILVSRESLKATQKTAFQIGLACSIGTAEVIVGGMLTAGSPFLHVIWVLVSLFAVFVTISSLNFSNASLTVSAVIALAIQLWDNPISAEVRVERTLYILLSILIACAVTVIIETVFAKKNPPDAVLVGISYRLSLVETFLGQVHIANLPTPALNIHLKRSNAKGVEELWEVLANSTYDEAFHDLMATLIALTRQLMDLTWSLAEMRPSLSEEDRKHCGAIARNLGLILDGLEYKRFPEWIDLAFLSHASNPIVLELERTTNVIAQSFSNQDIHVRGLVSVEGPTQSIMAFIAGALRDPEHFKFAVRGTLSAFLCYLFYMGTGWLSLGASILTCTLTARRLTGASRHRQSLRFAGFVVGAGIIGLGTEVFILPQMDSLAQYAILFASVVWIGSWIATSGPRVAFSGFQIVLAYNLVNLNRFTINTSLVPARDTILSIVVGIVGMWLVFDHLWAQTSSAALRSVLLTTLRNLAAFGTIAKESYPELFRRLSVENSKIRLDFDKMRELGDMYPFESFPKRPHEDLVNRSIRTLLPELRAFLLVKTGLMQQRSLSSTGIEEVSLREVEAVASSVLEELANAIENESTEPLSSWSVRARELRMKVTRWDEESMDSEDASKHMESHLCASLLDIASDLERRAEWIFAVQAGIQKESDLRSIQGIA